MQRDAYFGSGQATTKLPLPTKYLSIDAWAMLVRLKVVLTDNGFRISVFVLYGNKFL